MEKLQNVPEWIPEAEKLYKRAFPKNERIPFDILLKYPGNTADLYAFLEEKQLAGLACVVNASDISHITYFAVEESMRGKGYGTQILKMIREKKPGQRIIVDIERPEKNAGNEEQRVKRKQFYLHAGYEETPVEYTWRGEDYEILSNGGIIFEEEFDHFWDTILSEAS